MVGFGKQSLGILLKQFHYPRLFAHRELELVVQLLFEGHERVKRELGYT